MFRNSSDFMARNNGPSSLMPMLNAPPPHLMRGPYNQISTPFDDFKGLPSIIASQIFQSSFLQHPNNHHHGVALGDDACSFRPNKKKRLTIEQTKSLEHSFRLDTKLEPERKNKLALDLGLQPRQVAIWYQNRRARTKTKYIEDRFTELQEQYRQMLQEKEEIESEVDRLQELLRGLREIRGSSIQESDVGRVEMTQKDDVGLAIHHTQHLSNPANSRLDIDAAVHKVVKIEEAIKDRTDVEAESENLSCATTHCELSASTRSPTSAAQNQHDIIINVSTCDEAHTNQQPTMQQQYNFNVLYSHWDSDTPLESVDDMMGPPTTQLEDDADYGLFDLQQEVEVPALCWS